MSNIRQIEANRLNALKSTGPKTPEGKAAVRMNGLRHGLRARTVVLPGENPEDFHQLCDELETEWNPQSATEKFYVEQMAISHWKLIRIEHAEKSIVTQEAAAKTQIPLLDRLWQCQHRLERSYARAQRELERLQESRRPVDPPEDDDSGKTVKRYYMQWIDPKDPSNNSEIFPAGYDDPIDNNLVPPESGKDQDPQNG